MTRVDGYAPIRDYAVIGDGRTAALVAKDGSIDWLCLPDFDSGSVFGRVLDADRGGSFELQPEEPFESERRYEPDSNVLETTFRTASGAVRVIDAMALADDKLGPMREFVRRIEGLSGAVPMRWRVEPRFDFGSVPTRIELRAGRPFASGGRDAFALGCWDMGEPQLSEHAIEGRFVSEQGGTALLDLAGTHQEPVVLPCRADAERRLDQTRRFWPRWASPAEYDGEWRDEVVRSALVLKLCVYSPSGAIVAAPTTSLPEWIGGAKNWDYRFTWLRDASFALEALLRLGYRDEAHSFFWWFMHASSITHPRLQVLYRVNGSAHAEEDERPELAGYRGSRPVRIGNAALEQVQLDVYGDVLDSIWRFVRDGGELDRHTAKETASIADYMCKIWQQPDSGIWEVRRTTTDFVHSKAMVWIGLDRACKLAERGACPDRSERWRETADSIREWIDANGVDEERNTYVRERGARDLDAALLTLEILGYRDGEDPRLAGTIEAVREELAEGALVWRYRGEEEGAFLPCSFWLVDALARTGRVDEARSLMGDVLALANDVGLYSEEISRDGDFLGNFPQVLVHLALINAAVSCAGRDGE